MSFDEAVAYLRDECGYLPFGTDVQLVEAVEKGELLAADVVKVVEGIKREREANLVQ